jgi:hypothetical protein
MFRKDIKHMEGMGAMLPKVMVNIMMTTRIIQTQATIHTSMINAGVVFILVVVKEVLFLSLVEESHVYFAILQLRLPQFLNHIISHNIFLGGSHVLAIKVN